MSVVVVDVQISNHMLHSVDS